MESSLDHTGSVVAERPPERPPERSLDTLILTAMTLERDPIVKGLSGKRYKGCVVGAASLPRLYGGTFAGKDWVAAAVGVGPERAGAVADRLIEALAPERVVIAGLAGALDRKLNIADILIPASVIDVDDGETFEPLAYGTDHHVLATTATPRLSLVAKQKLYEKTAASAVDMESAAIGRVCQTRGLDWICVRAISDRADEALPDWIMGLSHPCGKPRLIAAMVRVMTKPWQLPILLKLGRQTKAATGTLVTGVMERLKNA